MATRIWKRIPNLGQPWQGGKTPGSNASRRPRQEDLEEEKEDWRDREKNRERQRQEEVPEEEQ